MAGLGPAIHAFPAWNVVVVPGGSPGMTARGLYRGSFRRLAARGGVEEAPAAGDLVGDEAGRDRRAVVVQDGDQSGRVDRALVDEQRAQLPIAVLLDHEDLIVREDEIDHLV